MDFRFLCWNTGWGVCRSSSSQAEPQWRVERRWVKQALSLPQGRGHSWAQTFFMLLGSWEVIGCQCCNRLHGSHFYLEISAFICKVFIMNLSTSVPTATTTDLLRSVVVVCFPLWPNGVWCQFATATFPCLSSACLTKTADVSSFHLLLHFHRCCRPASVNHAA